MMAVFQEAMALELTEFWGIFADSVIFLSIGNRYSSTF